MALGRSRNFPLPGLISGCLLPPGRRRIFSPCSSPVVRRGKFTQAAKSPPSGNDSDNGRSGDKEIRPRIARITRIGSDWFLIRVIRGSSWHDRKREILLVAVLLLNRATTSNKHRTLVTHPTVMTLIMADPFAVVHIGSQ